MGCFGDTPSVIVVIVVHIREDSGCCLSMVHLRRFAALSGLNSNLWEIDTEGLPLHNQRHYPFECGSGHQLLRGDAKGINHGTKLSEGDLYTLGRHHLG